MLERKKEIELELATLASQHNPDILSPDPSDQAASASFEDLAISLEQRQREEYDRILKALEMLAAGSYGICVDCGGDIEEKRLLVYPNASRCLACQKAYEQNVC
ncbi:MAG: hypothetical protein UU47_C0009G0020 [candidate division TM6 bacterium GW2011_GWE2_41_16]|nr:MAG: hypothetical protein UU47_C0009G0020 [candidate division TM6 bacterium GW2011_GWE2_41_16]